MNSHFITMFLCLLTSASIVGQVSDRRAEIFLPGIVSGDSVDFNACFSPDGKSFYFSRTVNKKSKIYENHLLHQAWSKPEPLPFCKDGYSYADPAFSPAGELYFISNRPTMKSDTVNDYDIWKTSLINGRWTDPVNMKILNSPEEEYYVSFASNGDLYFSSSRPGGYGEEDIYVAKFVDDRFIAPDNVGAAVNSIRSEYDPCISANGRVLIFASSGRTDSFGKADLYWTEKYSDWQAVHHLDSVINTSSRDYCPYISRQNDFYFSSEGEVKMLPSVYLPYSLKLLLQK